MIAGSSRPAPLPHYVRIGRYGGRLMTLAEFQAREELAELRRTLSCTGPLGRLSATGVSMHLTNRLRVEFGFDADGMIRQADLDAAVVLLIEIHAKVRAIGEDTPPGALLDVMRAVVGGGHNFPSKGRSRRAHWSLH